MVLEAPRRATVSQLRLFFFFDLAAAACRDAALVSSLLSNDLTRKELEWGTKRSSEARGSSTEERACGGCAPPIPFARSAEAILASRGPFDSRLPGVPFRALAVLEIDRSDDVEFLPRRLYSTADTTRLPSNTRPRCPTSEGST